MLLMVFAATPLRAQSYTDLRDFDCSTGCTPYDGGRLTQGADGYLYGTTGYGGTANKGTIFKVNTAGTSYNVVWNFDGTNSGELPTAALTLATDGNFYGTTAGGGTSNYGTLFSFNPKTLALNVLHDFSSAESSSDAPPIEATNKVLHGVLYGTTQSGEVYTFNLKTQTFQPLPYKTPGDPNASLVQASDGYLYGVSQVGGKDNAGTIFRVSLAGKVKILYAFTAGTDGASPTGPLVEGKGGLFGTTYYAGSSTHDAGVVFMLALPSLQFTTLHIFVGTDGSRPAAGLKAATDGSFYGTTAYGGANGVGTIFQITPSGTFTHLFDFTGMGGSVSGNGPGTTLMEDTNGILYGLTTYGGANGTGEGDGVFYSLTLPDITPNIILCCNWWVILDQPVLIFGDNLEGVVSVDFGSVPAQFRLGSNTYLTAFVPSNAIDSLITVTLASGGQLQSQQIVHILPKITNLDPSSGPVGTQVRIVGGGFAGARAVTFGGVAASFNVRTPAEIEATVPTGAVTGKVDVTTPNGVAHSKQTFTVN
jgi:uncharacterized repeat protein (TIGR03803 family)